MGVAQGLTTASPPAVSAIEIETELPIAVVCQKISSF
jgi:hypothetical protein